MGNLRQQLWPGVPLALASAAMFGLTAPVSKALIGTVDPWMLAGLLYLGAGIGLAGVRGAQALRSDKQSSEAPLKRADLPWLVAVIGFGGVLGPVLLMAGLARTSASSASLMLNLEGVATMVLAWTVFGENVDRRLMAGAGAIVTGALLLSWQGGAISLDGGALLVACACVCWGLDNNLTGRISAADPVQIAMIKGIAAGATNVAIALWLNAAWPPAPALGGAAVLGFCGIGLSLVLYMLALRHLGTARTGAYFSLAPFIGALLALALFPEVPSLQMLAAAVLMGLGVWLHLTERHEHEHVHEALEHEHRHVHDVHHQHHHDGPVTEPHSHWHRHEPIRHTHPHYPDLHHRHRHP